MNTNKLKKTMIGVAKDVAIAFVIVCIVMLALFAYCGIWPPMVVVESGSMQRYDDRSLIGVIDTGDMVFVKDVNGVDDVITYVEGEAMDYARYGTFGDVVVFRPNGEEERVQSDNVTVAVIPIIHRLVAWMDVNETGVNPDFEGIDYANYTFDVPSLGIFNSTETIVLSNYGFYEQNVNIDLGGVLAHYMNTGKTPHGGYITMGDNNVPRYDQHPVGPYEPVLPEWIVGKAVGEMPWFGLIKLGATGASLHGVARNSWVGLYSTMFLLLFVPFMLDMLGPRFLRWRRNRGNEDVEETPAEPREEGAAAEIKEAEPPPEKGDAPRPVPEGEGGFEEPRKNEDTPEK